MQYLTSHDGGVYAVDEDEYGDISIRPMWTLTVEDIRRVVSEMNKHRIPPKRVKTQEQADTMTASDARLGIDRVWHIGDDYYEMWAYDEHGLHVDGVYQNSDCERIDHRSYRLGDVTGASFAIDRNEQADQKWGAGPNLATIDHDG